MAKIGSLEVGTIKIGNAAATGSLFTSFNSTFINETRTLTVPNTYGNPVAIFWDCAVELYGGGSSGTATAAASFGIYRTGTTELYRRSATRSGTNSLVTNWGGALLDFDAGSSSEFYEIDLYMSAPGVASGSIKGAVTVVYYKK